MYLSEITISYIGLKEQIWPCPAKYYFLSILPIAKLKMTGDLNGWHGFLHMVASAVCSAVKLEGPFKAKYDRISPEGGSKMLPFDKCFALFSTGKSA